MNPLPLDRRAFLRSLGLAGAGATLSSLPPLARRALAAAEESTGMIVRNDWPEHWETSLTALGRSWLTPTDLFFVRSHLNVPEIKPAEWRLAVTGKVQTPLTLTLAQLQAMTSTEYVAVLECAGNGRARYALPSTSGTQWEFGAVGNARWTGVRLSSVLDRAGLQSDGAHLWFECADAAPFDSTPRFVRSLPVAELGEDVLLAWKMNGAPLSPRHGGPLRLIVPGAYGVAWSKWVTRIRVETLASDNHFMTKGYRYLEAGTDPTIAPPVFDMRVKSIITRPLDSTHVLPGKVRVQGFAWAGSRGLKVVEISTDEGKSWRPAGFMGDSEPHSWRLWATEVPLVEGASVSVMARATENGGDVQPLAAKPNLGGYANNSIHRVTFRA